MTDTAKHSEFIDSSTSISTIVDWDDENDPGRPKNWSTVRRWAIVVTTTLITFVVSFSSSVFSATLAEVADEFDVSKNVVVLGITLFVLGFAFGPLLWGPASELHGRTTPLWLGYTAFLIFQLPLAISSEIRVILTSRFLAGLFGSAPLAIVAGMYVDFLNPMERGISNSAFSVGVFCGPVTAPILGNIITEHLGWRWTGWITLFVGLVLGIVCFVCTPETADSILLQRKAQSLRLETGNWALHARCEEQPARMRTFVEKYLTKPVKMLVLEPVLLIFTIYMSLVYGILYLTFTMYPYSFHTIRKMSSIEASLPFLFLLAGIVLACLFLGLYSVYYIGRLQRAGKTLTPEHRLPPVILGSLLLPAGLFWFAWTSQTQISWTLQATSGIFTGCGIILVFMTSILFLVEVYLYHANSALAMNTFVRSIVAASFPVFSRQMFSTLAIKWTGTMLACICVALTPFPVVMMVYGSHIRGWSKFAR
ncbi:hypothetical protein M409DRAFT_55797 [Zasmidium cellare ATCC 36951]|uniref:Cercosporin MFS transporter CTB4 n=1 Tax=Zasmidium cellare ATCC 36951 TaxID=1080233 RepID=A0A6A6CE81_ZASCE|nr:uncharacterized protein M409DRAFT_55797 [Zasmidium cellare ATCC 36951]KAF2165391.1 hypothetical protein M409DRAFT_55797 [Zasmidium cellare ATCC 36951]